MIGFLRAGDIASFGIVLVDGARRGAGSLIVSHLVQVLRLSTVLVLLGHNLNVACVNSRSTEDGSDFLLTKTSFLVLNLSCSLFEFHCCERVRNCLHFEGCEHIFVCRELDAKLLARLLNDLMPREACLHLLLQKGMTQLLWAHSVQFYLLLVLGLSLHG